MESYLTNFSVGTGAVGTTISVTGFGFTPKAGILWTSGRNESVDTAGAQTMRHVLGVFTSPSNRYGITMLSDEGAATSATWRSTRNDAVVVALNTSGSLNGLLDVTTVAYDNVVFTVDDQFSGSGVVRVFLLLLGGPDLQASLFDFDAAVSTGTVNYTNPGFAAESVLFFSDGDNTAFPTNSNNAALLFGAAARTRSGTTKTGVTTVRSYHNLTTSSTARYCRYEAECVAFINVSTPTIVTTRAELSSWLSTGFQLNWVEVEAGANRNIVALALRGAAFDVVSFTAVNQAPDTIDTVSGVGFQPTAALASTHMASFSAADTGQTTHAWSLGGFAQNYPGSAIVQGVQSALDVNGAATTVIQTVVDFNQVVEHQATATAAQDGSLYIVDTNSNGFRIANASSPGSNYDVWFWLAGDPWPGPDRVTYQRGN